MPAIHPPRAPIKRAGARHSVGWGTLKPILCCSVRGRASWGVPLPPTSTGTLVWQGVQGNRLEVDSECGRARPTTCTGARRQGRRWQGHRPRLPPAAVCVGKVGRGRGPGDKGAGRNSLPSVLDEWGQVVYAACLPMHQAGRVRHAVGACAAPMHGRYKMAGEVPPVASVLATRARVCPSLPVVLLWPLPTVGPPARIPVAGARPLVAVPLHHHRCPSPAVSLPPNGPRGRRRTAPPTGTAAHLCWPPR